ncbi:MAG: methionyl-tRNA formyltransferase [Actinomycetia bacterium]|nr:methionyl-tRNA formyltransferase [Actinomycetes bacterium]
MKIAYIGSSEFSVPFLEKIDDSRHEVTGVFTYKDKKKGRGRKLLSNPVKKCAASRGIPVHEISECGTVFMEKLSAVPFDYAVVVSFGMILPAEVFKRWPQSWLNVHPSMLPAYRGPSPMISALLEGAAVTGVTINEVVYEVDTGRIFAQKGFSIADSDNLDDLEKKAVKFGAPLLINVLDLIEDTGYEPRPQGNRGITYTRKITAGDLRIDWSGKAAEIVNRIRALSTKPGAYTEYRDGKIKILRASVIAKGKKGASAGEIIYADKNEGLIVNCGGGGAVSIEVLQPQGKKTMDHKSFINGYGPETGSIMGK